MAVEGRRPGLSRSCILIIVVAGVERFAYKGVASNLVTYLADVMKLGTSEAAKSVNNWSGVTSMLPLLGAFLADSYWDRYATILGSSLLYVVGLVALTSWALLCDLLPTSSLFLPLYIISVGQGGYNPSLQAFGADQLEIEDDMGVKSPEEKSNQKRKSLFFHWWYFGICSGSLLGNSAMSYVQDNYGWELGFAIPAAVMAASVACFTAGGRWYVRKQAGIAGSGARPIGDVVRGIKQAVASRLCCGKRKHAGARSAGNVIRDIKEAAANRVQGGTLTLPPKEDDLVELEMQAKPLCERPERSDTAPAPEKKTDSAEPRPSVAKTILKLLPVWAMLVMFAVIFQLPSTFFTRQGAVMDRRIGPSFTVPPAALQSAITISIILLMPLYDKLIIPVTRVVTRRDEGISVLQRIGVGMLLSIVAMVVAALVEAQRVRATATAGDGGPYRLRILWLLPQYVLLGVSDVFTVVGMQEFFYTQVPRSTRAVGIGLYLSVFGVGSFLGSALITVVEAATAGRGKGGHGWISDDMADARLDKYYWLLAALSGATFLAFMCVSKGYEDDREGS